MVYEVYYSSVSSSTDIRKKQEKIFLWLDSQNVKYEIKDVAEGSTLSEMRKKADNDKALAPQIFKDDVHLGGYKEIEDAAEDKNLRGFLKLDGDGDPSQQTQQAQQP